jgi:haloacetate dehalogenase
LVCGPPRVRASTCPREEGIELAYFEGFALAEAEVGEVRLRYRHGGSGPAVVLLHGHPRTHATWHRVAVLLAPLFTVVCPDLRGYGQSTLPPTRPDHSQSSKRAMAADVVALMRLLGHEHFAVAGHDRGSSVAYRLALDHPHAVTRLAVLDGIPIGEHLARADARFAQAWWHWFFFGQLEKPAERVINADPEAWYSNTAEHMGPEAYADLWAALRDPDVVHGMLEDYRAGLGVDRAADDADRAAGRTIACPVLAGWSTEDDLEDLYGDVVEVWRPWAPDVRGVAIRSGHHMAEEAPDELARVLAAFLGSGGAAPPSSGAAPTEAAT